MSRKPVDDMILKISRRNRQTSKADSDAYRHRQEHECRPTSWLFGAFRRCLKITFTDSRLTCPSGDTQRIMVQRRESLSTEIVPKDYK